MSRQQFLNDLVSLTIKEGASDLHLCRGSKPLLRVAGALIPLLKQQELSQEDMEGIMEILLTEKNREVFLKEKEIDFSYNATEGARFRCNGYFQQGAIGFALRLIPKKILTLEELNLPTALKSFTDRKQGFFLVVGPVGQGKTTTLAAMIDLINSKRADRIVTIEDPIEYLFEAKKSTIIQREVKIDTMDFNTALLSAFRQDVNVIMVGEMRGLETISAAVTAAETGHLVFSTLHTNDAPQTIDRIIDSFPSTQQQQIRIQLAGSLAGIFSQRLVQRVAGRLIPIYELLINTPAVANLIRESRTHEIPTVIETGSEHGMIDMDRVLANLVHAGEISVDTAYQHAKNPGILERYL